MVNQQRTRARRTLLLLSSAQSAQLEALRQALSGPAPADERWTSRMVTAWMSERLGRPVAYQHGWDELQRLGARLRQPRPWYVAASAEEQAACKSGAALPPLDGGSSHAPRPNDSQSWDSAPARDTRRT